jgi:two-component system sensor histidine kinase KdpD
MPEARANKFLELIRRSERGRLKVYLGYGPGVGKTFQMLQEAHRLKSEGIDVVVGLVETHGRAETEGLVSGLEVLPRRRVEYRGITVEEFDVDGCLARKPQVAVVDELAHTNVPGGRNAKRYEDVQELLAAGIHVVTAMNVQHLESLYNTVESLVGVKVRERIPDSVLADADQVVNIDLAPEDLQKRLREGKIYPKERVVSSLENFFQAGNLEHLRELALRELASQIDSRRREQPAVAAAAAATDQIMVCLSSRGPNSARLLRFGSRLAGRLNRNWYAVYVQTPREEPTVIDAVTQRLLSDTLTLANQLGATVFTFKGSDVADTILRFAREYRVGQVVIGKPRAIPWWKRLAGHKSVAEELIFRATGVTVIVVDADSQEQLASELPAAPTSDSSAAVARPAKAPSLAELVRPDGVVVWEDPVSKEQVLRALAGAALNGTPGVTVEDVLKKLTERERQGSTFLNEGVALPHARVESLAAPRVAVGVTHAGVLDAPTEKRVEVVVLMLSPESGPASHLQLLAAAGRALGKKELRTRLRTAKNAADAFEILGALR